MTFISNRNVYLSGSVLQGRGVFAKREIPPSSVIEVAPIIEFCGYVSRHLIRSACGERFIAWQTNDAGEIVSSVTACGLMMFCNHSDRPNAVFVKDFERSLISLVSEVRIFKDEEILIKYSLRKTF